MEEQKYMKRCLELAALAKENGKTAVGSLVVKDGEIIGEGIEGDASLPNLISHAEIIAIITATKNIGSDDLSNCELYTTVEPCFMCSYIIRQTKIKSVIYGASAGDIGGASSKYPILGSKSISNWSSPPEIVAGIMKAECENILKK